MTSPIMNHGIHELPKLEEEEEEEYEIGGNWQPHSWQVATGNLITGNWHWQLAIGNLITGNSGNRAM